MVSVLLALGVVIGLGGCETRDGSDRFFIPRGDAGVVNVGDRGGDRGGGVDFGTGDLGEDGLTIYDLQDASRPNHPAPDTDVEVVGVITAIDTLIANDDPATAGAFFIAHPNGGPFSGIEIFNNRGDVDVTALSVGQTVRVTGTYVEFFELSEIRVAGAEVIDEELNPVEPVIVDPAAVATGGEAAEDYEGVLVTVENVTVTDTGVGFGKFAVTGGLEIDDSLFRLPSIPNQGTEFESITGVLTYTFDAVQLLPRSEDDFVGGNTGNGGGEVSIYDVQDVESETYAGLNSTVIVEGVVTAIDTLAREDAPDSTGSFWIQDPAGGAFSGVQVFNAGGETDISALAVGMTVEVEGRLEEFNGLTEIRLSTFTIVDEALTPVTPELVSAADVATDGTDAERYEGVLVTIEDARVIQPSIGFGKFELAGGLEVDDELYALPSAPAAGTTYETLTGVLTFSFEAVQLLPRSDDDYGEEGTTTDVAEVRINDIQDSTSEDFPGIGARVEFSGRVTAMNNTLFWVQRPAGGPYSGIVVEPPVNPSSLVAIGDTVTVVGIYIEDFEQSLITAEEVTVTSDSPNPLLPEVVDPADVSTGAELAEAYEGVFVRVRDVTVTDNGIGFGKFVVTGGLEIDDFIFRYTLPTNGTTYRRVDGVLSYSFDAVQLLPRSASDLVEE